MVVEAQGSDHLPYSVLQHSDADMRLENWGTMTSNNHVHGIFLRAVSRETGGEVAKNNHLDKVY